MLVSDVSVAHSLTLWIFAPSSRPIRPGVDEIANVDTSNPTDGSAVANAAGYTLNAGNVTPTVVGDLPLAMLAINDVADNGVTASGWTVDSTPDLEGMGWLRRPVCGWPSSGGQRDNKALHSC